MLRVPCDGLASNPARGVAILLVSFAAVICVVLTQIKGAFLWDYSGYSHSGLGITEYTEYQFPKERIF